MLILLICRVLLRYHMYEITHAALYDKDQVGMSLELAHHREKVKEIYKQIEEVIAAGYFQRFKKWGDI